MSALGDKLRALAAEADAAAGEAPSATLPIAPSRRDYGREAYLRAHDDVRNNATFGTAPLAHWMQHGFLEGRKWPVVPPAGVLSETITTPGGRTFPLPAPVSPEGKPGENLWGYLGRVARHLGREEEWNRTSVAAMAGLNHLVPRSVPYPDGYRGYFDDPNHWPALAEAHFFAAPQAADPGWAAVHERMKQGTHPAWQEPAKADPAPDVPPAALPDGETPL